MHFTNEILKQITRETYRFAAKQPDNKQRILQSDNFSSR
jgi:hypothetical protein